ncbi:hypothetical protein EFL45_10560 [Weissella confusa]|nr:hypothetical protein [Weissella confusa]
MGWQQIGYGKSINNQAPSQLMNIIKQKLALHGYEPRMINTMKARLSQYHHDTGEYIKSPRDERARQIALKDTVYNVQRDVYSAFLGTYLNDNHTIDDISDADFEHFLTMQDNMVKRIRREHNIILDSMGMRYDYTIA